MAARAISARVFVPLEHAGAWVGRELFVTDWITATPRHLAQFHAATDLDPALTDMQVCDANPVPDIVDGFWLQAMLAAVHFNHNPIRSPGMWGLNLGSDRVRFIAPVRLGQRLRFHCTLDAVLPHAHGSILVSTNTAELEGSARPAMVAVLRMLASTQAGLPAAGTGRAAT